MAVAKDQIRQIITENNITSVADVYSLLKDSFKDILQELLEAEMDATLGYEKNCKGDLKSDNKRNGHSPKTLKSANSHFLRTAGPYFPDSPGHIKRTAWDISRAEGTPPY